MKRSEADVKKSLPQEASSSTVVEALTFLILKRLEEFEKTMQLENNKLEIAPLYDTVNIIEAAVEAREDQLKANPRPVDAQEQVELQGKKLQLTKTKTSKLLEARQFVFEDMNIRHGREGEYTKTDAEIKALKKEKYKNQLAGHRETLAVELYPPNEPVTVSKRYLSEPQRYEKDHVIHTKLRRAVLQLHQNLSDGAILYLPRGSNAARGAAHLIEIGEQEFFREKQQCFKNVEDFSAQYVVLNVVLNSYSDRTTLLLSHLLEFTLRSNTFTKQLSCEVRDSVAYQSLQAKEVEGTILRANLALIQAARQAIEFTGDLGTREPLHCTEASARKIDQPHLLFRMGVAELVSSIDQRCSSWSPDDKVNQEDLVTSVVGFGGELVNQLKGDKNVLTEASELVDSGFQTIVEALEGQRLVVKSPLQASFNLAKAERVAQVKEAQTALKLDVEKNLEGCRTSTPISYVAPKVTPKFIRASRDLVKKFKL